MNRKKFLFAIFISFFSLAHNYALFKFKKFNDDSNNNVKEYSLDTFTDNIYNKYYSFLNVGNPPQKTEVKISIDAVGLSMQENTCWTSYYFNKNKSLTLTQTHNFDISDYSRRTIIVNDTIDFSVFNITEKSSKIATIPEYSFIYRKINQKDEEEFIEKEKEGKACINMGFKLACKREDFFCKNISGYLKEKEITNSSTFHFYYLNEKEKKENEGYDAFLYIGDYPHEYNKEKYPEESYVSTNAEKWISDLAWIMRIHNYYYLSNGTQISFLINQEILIKGLFDFNLDIIIGISQYYHSIKIHYFDNYTEKCTIHEKYQNRYTIITCDKDFNTETFPTLYFSQPDYNYTFELTHEDLFQIRGDRKYFLIVFDTLSNYPWKFGRLFMQKYFFNFDVDSKTIGFYSGKKNNPSKDDNKSKKDLLWILWVSLIIITGVGCFFLGKFIYDKTRKKRANELDDDYEYKQKNDEEGMVTETKGNDLGLN